MTLLDRHFAYIARCTDKGELRNMMLNARKPGEQSLEDAAFRRLIALVPEAEPGTLEHDFWTVIQAFELVLKEERGRTTLLARTRQKVKRDGIVATLSAWATGKPTEGFEMLKARRMLELSGEAIILKHADKFPGEVAEAARARLDGEAAGDQAPA